MSTHMLITITPKPGRMLDSLAGQQAARKVLTAHADIVTQWRTLIGGASTGVLYTALSWSSVEASAVASEAMVADPNFQAHMAKYAVGDVANVSMPGNTLGFDVPGFENMGSGVNTTTVPRVSSTVALVAGDETLALLPELQARAAQYGHKWFCRLWVVGTPIGSPMIVSYDLHESRVAWGRSMDRQLADRGTSTLNKRLSPHVIGRVIVSEVLG